MVNFFCESLNNLNDQKGLQKVINAKGQGFDTTNSGIYGYMGQVMRKCVMSYANNKGAHQPAHPRSLISTFVVRCLDSMICILAISKVSRF